MDIGGWHFMNEEIKRKIDHLAEKHCVEREEDYLFLIKELFSPQCQQEREYLYEKAGELRDRVFGKTIYIRGLIEVSNICKNDCYYCGIRRSNRNACRYRMEKEEILDCCRRGYQWGFRTFVLQGGEDPRLTDEVVESCILAIKEQFPDCAVTLSLGEKEKESYERFFRAGADRYLLRHETATEEHYGRLHPPALRLSHRINCLRDLKEIGYQTGCGCMVGSPYQTVENLAEDLKFIKKFDPEMVGMGPFISHKDTPFKDFKNGTLEQTLVMLGIVRLLLPQVLLPATTALGTIHPQGREMGILAGANVVMPNLSPVENRKKYMLYDNKLGTGEESGEGVQLLKHQMKAIGYEVVVDRGDYHSWKG